MSLFCLFTQIVCVSLFNLELEHWPVVLGRHKNMPGSHFTSKSLQLLHI